MLQNIPTEKDTLVLYERLDIDNRRKQSELYREWIKGSVLGVSIFYENGYAQKFSDEELIAMVKKWQKPKGEISIKREKDYTVASFEVKEIEKYKIPKKDLYSITKNEILELFLQHRKAIRKDCESSDYYLFDIQRAVAECADAMGHEVIFSVDDEKYTLKQALYSQEAVDFPDDFIMEWNGKIVDDAWGAFVDDIIFINEPDEKLVELAKYTDKLIHNYDTIVMGKYKKDVIHIDLDGVVVDLVSEAEKELAQFPEKYKTIEDVIDTSETVFINAKPIDGAIEGIKKLMENYEVFILSTAPWENTHSWSQKRIWVEKHFPELKKRLILTHHKDFVIGHFLIDDRLKNGVEDFTGKHIHFGQGEFQNWEQIINYFNRHID